MLWDCFQVSYFPGAKHWVKSPWCAGIFRQVWVLPGGIRQDPLGSQGCVPQPLTAQRGGCLCKGPPPRLWASMGHMVDASTPRPSPQHSWCTQMERVLGIPLFVRSTSGQRMMGWFITSVGVFFWSQGWSQVLDEIQSGAWTHDGLAGELICSNNALVNLGHQRKKKILNLCNRASFRGSLWKQAIWLHCSAFVNSPAYYCFPAGWHMLNLSHI